MQGRGIGANGIGKKKQEKAEKHSSPMPHLFSRFAFRESPRAKGNGIPLEKKIAAFFLFFSCRAGMVGNLALGLLG